MAAELNAKHVVWNSRLSTRRGKLPRDYDDKNSNVTLGPHTPTTNPYNPSATIHVFDIMITKKLSSLLYPIRCSELRSDNLPVLI